jgi:putative transposase
VLTFGREYRRRLTGIVAGVRHALRACLWARPVVGTHAAGIGGDLLRSRAQLLAENALLRQQLLVLRRSVKRPAVTRADRALLVLLAGRIRAWREALLLIQPETLLRWHRAGFLAFWRRKSRRGPGRPPLAAETVALLQRMAADNPLWGAERIRGELGQLGLRVAKRTIQTYLRATPAPRPRGQAWATFLRNHAHEIWACDFLPVTDLLFRPLFAFFVIELATRRVVHIGATRHPTDAWVAQQLREATLYDQHPRYLIRDNDGKFGAAFARVAAASGIEILRTPYRAPRANATCERFLGSVRRECLDHLLVLGERHLARLLREYAAYFNRARPHQGLGQELPEPPTQEDRSCDGPICVVPILGGLHHTYQRAA